MNNLMHCTFTGIDEFCSLEKVRELSIAFPFVEWGVLLSTSENSSFGRNRYPSVRWLQDNLPILKDISNSSGASIALHVCGKEVKKLLSRDDDSVAVSLLPFVNRVQINFVYKESQVEQLEKLCTDFPLIKFITQQNNVNYDLYKKIKSKNHQILFDQSGGRGIETKEWSEPLENKVCGYAGGLGIDNIIYQLRAIRNIANSPFWIDMEGKLRVDDKLNLNICENILKAIQ